MWRSAARVMRIVPVSVTSSTENHCSSVISVERGGAAEAGVVHEHVEVAELAEHVGEAAVDVVLRGHVGEHRVRAELLGRLAQPAFVDVADRDACAFLDAALRGREADAGSGGGGDEHGLAGEQAAPGRVVGRRRARWSLRLLRQAQGPFPDHVALDLVRAAVDRVGAAVEEQASQRVVGRRPFRAGPHTSIASSPSARWNVAQNSLWIDVAGVDGAVLEHGQRAQRVEAHHAQRDPRVGEPLPQHRDRTAPPFARARSVIVRSSCSNASCWPSVDAPRSNASVPIATRQPSSTSPTTFVGRGARAVEERLVELASAR